VVTCHHSTSVVRSLKLLPLPQIYRTIISLSTNVTVSTRVVLVSYPVWPTGRKQVVSEYASKLNQIASCRIQGAILSRINETLAGLVAMAGYAKVRRILIRGSVERISLRDS
jgi:hypothetical protein